MICLPLLNIPSFYLSGSFSITKCTIIGLVGGEGNSSVFYFYDENANISIKECLIDECICVKKYGAITLHSACSLNLSKCFFRDNKAKEGPDFFILWTMDNEFRDFCSSLNSFFRSVTLGYVGNYVGAKGKAEIEMQNFSRLSSTVETRFSSFSVYMININFEIKNTVVESCTDGIGIIEITSSRDTYLRMKDCGFVKCKSKYFISANANWSRGLVTIEDSTIFGNNFSNWASEYVNSVTFDKCYIGDSANSKNITITNSKSEKFETSCLMFELECEIAFKESHFCRIGISLLRLLFQSAEVG